MADNPSSHMIYDVICSTLTSKRGIRFYQKEEVLDVNSTSSLLWPLSCINFEPEWSKHILRISWIQRKIPIDQNLHLSK